MLAPEVKQTQLNRQQRKTLDKLKRSASFAKASPYRQAVELHRNGLGFLIPPDVYREITVPMAKPLALLHDCRPFEEGEVDLDIVKIRDAYVRLKDGSADEGDFMLVGIALNMAKVRAMEIDMGMADEIELAQDAMNKCRERYLKHGRFGFDGVGIQAMGYAMDAHDAILQSSAPKQMQIAAIAVRKILLQIEKNKRAININI